LRRTLAELPGHTRNAAVTGAGNEIECTGRQVNVAERAAIAAVPDFDNDGLAGRRVGYGRLLATDGIGVGIRGGTGVAVKVQLGNSRNLLAVTLDLTTGSHACVVKGHLASLSGSMILALDAHVCRHPHHRCGLNGRR
jgi:hypothetical protein